MQKNNRRFTHDELKEAVSIVGGRLSFLSKVYRVKISGSGYLTFVLKVAKSRDMVNTAKNLLSVEKGWLLSQIGKCVLICFHTIDYIYYS